MASAVVYDDVAEGADVAAGALFEGYKFWLAQRVPTRASYLAKIEANGGQIVKLEKQADFLIADHFRRDCPPGSISYEFIDRSITQGSILDPDDFPAGPRAGTSRDAGSIVRPAKGTRAAYTPEEDRQLYKWVKDAARNGVAIAGNELYKKLEEKNPRHTWQSWRDRYLKKLQHMPPDAWNIPDNAPPSPPSDQSSRAAEMPVRRTGLVKNKEGARLDGVAESASMGTAASKEQPASKVRDTPTEQITEPVIVKRTGLVKNKDKARTNAATRETVTSEANTSKELPGNSTQSIASGPSSKELSIDQLVATFSTEDWEELYAFVEHIDEVAHDEHAYETSWTNWAENKDNQTSSQWRQYYERVVRPQWLSDPVSKRDRIRRKVEERHANDSSSPTKSQSQSWSQTQDNIVAASQKDNTASQEGDIGVSSKAPVTSQQTVENTSPPDSRLESEATAQQETPRYIRNGYEAALKRIRGDDDASENAAQDAATGSTDAARPTKMRKYSLTPSPEVEAVNGVNGTQELPLAISSRVSSRQGSQQGEGEQLETEEPTRPRTQHRVSHIIDLGDEASSEASEEDVEPLAPLPREHVEDMDQEDWETNDLESIASSTDLTHITPLPRPPQIPEASDDEEDDLPSNTPTPRANKYAPFDTQAILSPSQTQNAHFMSRLPRPPIDSSPLHHPESEASTTQSLQEFSSYLQDAEDTGARGKRPVFRPAGSRSPRPPSLTPSATSEAESVGSNASTASGSGSGDPDPPLETSEFDGYFTEQNAEGFNNEYITKALKRTRFRPGLATTVLETWRNGLPLPDKRGIWSLEEDELVESGDGAALARLGRKHTVDGWGGITERMNFLSAWSRR